MSGPDVYEEKGPEYEWWWETPPLESRPHGVIETSNVTVDDDDEAEFEEEAEVELEVELEDDDSDSSFYNDGSDGGEDDDRYDYLEEEVEEDFDD